MIRFHDDEVAVGGPKPRMVLLRLLLDPGTLVSVDSLIDAVWEDQAPTDAAKNVQIYVARMRKFLPAGFLVSGSGGYRVECDRTNLDATRFDDLIAAARRAAAAGRTDEAVEGYVAAEGLWRGDALADARYATFAQSAIAYYEQLRESAREEQIALRLERGEGPELVPLLDRLVRAEPLRERRWGQLMVAYYQAGRQTDALRTFDRLRTTFAEEMGLDPSPELRELELRILEHDPSLSPNRSGWISTTGNHSAKRPDPGCTIVCEVTSTGTTSTRSAREAAIEDVAVIAQELVSKKLGNRVAVVQTGHDAEARATSLLAVARPGEVVVDQAIQSTLVERLANSVTLVPAGWIESPSGFSAAYLLSATGAPPALMAPIGRGNLPAYRNAFLGRDHDLASLEQQIHEAPAVTITGPGGIGKTRLAVEYASRSADEYLDGAWMIDLAGVSHADVVWTKIRDVLAMPATWDVEVVTRTIADRKLLLVIDNCEHLAIAVGALVDAITANDSNATVIATSRTRLGRPGERVIRLDPLAWGHDDQAPAVQLLAARARELGVELGPTPLLGSLCEAVAGIPLAIELAVAQLGHLSVAQLLARMDHQLDVLASNPGRGRHSSIHAAFQSGLSLLSPPAHVTLLDASVFRSAFDLRDLAAVTGTSDPSDEVRDLVTFSMVTTATGAGPVARYRLLEPLRQFAYAGLLASDRAETVHVRHAEYHLTIADDLHAGRRSPEGLENATANLAAAHDWSRGSGRDDLAMRIAATLLSLPATVRTKPGAFGSPHKGA